MNYPSPGAALRRALVDELPLQVPGTINANHALLAQRAGFKAIYLSGGGVAAGSLGLPDLGISTLDDVLTDVRRITDVCNLPLLVDVDTGFGPSAFNVARTVKSLIKAGAAGLHIEDQVGAKRCGHRPGNEIVSQAEMVDRVKAAVDARSDASFAIMARSDALAGEGLDRAIERLVACVTAGADMIFPEALTDLDMYRRVVDAVGVPVLANITEFGSTPLFTVEDLRSVGVALALYPLSSAGHLAIEYLKMVADLEMTHIPYKGTGQMLIDLVSGRLELSAVGAPAILPFIQERKLRCIATGSTKRVAQLPEVPSVAEQGFPDFEMTQWYGLLAPSNLAPENVAKLSAAAMKGAKSPAFVERLNGDAAEAIGDTPEQFAQFIAAEQVRWQKVIASAKITPD